ncbi:MAG: hypothetical protein LWW85_08040 [Marinilabiliales bacterium]|nr:hypothetical protein [Marinilabiliales bacterium]
MELYLDLLPKREKSRFQLVLGIVTLLLGISYLLFLWISHKEYFLPLGLYMILLGINSVLMGLGYHAERLFGKAFICVNEEIIALKPGVMQRERRLYWKDIQSIHYQLNKFRMVLTDGTTREWKLSSLEYAILIRTRQAILEMAARKGIEIVP